MQKNSRVIKGGDVDPEIVEAHALGSVLEFETLDRVLLNVSNCDVDLANPSILPFPG